MNVKKKVLVLSNACFSDADSNGRTLEQLCAAFGSEDLAQFFTYGAPNPSFCQRYYQVSDKMALQSFLKQRETGGPVKDFVQQDAPSVSSTRKVKKTPLSMLLREIAWKFGRWNGAKLNTWIDEFEPDAMLVSLGDNTFLPRLARKTAEKRNIPVYVYSTENYNFKNYNYITKRPSLLYWLFYTWLNQAYKKLTPYVKCGIFNTPLLAEAYQKAYGYPCHCIFNPSDIDWVTNATIGTQIKVSYLGNLGVNRYLPLLEIANTLSELFPGTKLNIYGRLPADPAAKNAILNCPNIDFQGFVAYQDVVQIIHDSTLVVHAEYDDPFWSKDLKYAFSTKIADSVCSGTPLLIYARKDLAVTDFLIRNQCAFVVENQECLKAVLYQALSDMEARKTVLEAAKKAKQMYFTPQESFLKLMEEM